MKDDVELIEEKRERIIGCFPIVAVILITILFKAVLRDNWLSNLIGFRDYYQLFVVFLVPISVCHAFFIIKNSKKYLWDYNKDVEIVTLVGLFFAGISVCVMLVGHWTGIDKIEVIDFIVRAIAFSCFPVFVYCFVGGSVAWIIYLATSLLLLFIEQILNNFITFLLLSIVVLLAVIALLLYGMSH